MCYDLNVTRTVSLAIGIKPLSDEGPD